MKRLKWKGERALQRLKYLFTIPNGESVTEKHLHRVLISSVCSILLCLTCLVSATWAWYVVSWEADFEIITAKYELEVEYTKQDGLNKNEDGSYTLANSVAETGMSKEFAFTLKKVTNGENPKNEYVENGYGKIVITVNDKESIYYTAPISTFYYLMIEVPVGCEATVCFFAQWGTYSGTDDMVQNVDGTNRIDLKELYSESDLFEYFEIEMLDKTTEPTESTAESEETSTEAAETTEETAEATEATEESAETTETTEESAETTETTEESAETTETTEESAETTETTEESAETAETTEESEGTTETTEETAETTEATEEPAETAETTEESSENTEVTEATAETTEVTEKTVETTENS